MRASNLETCPLSCQQVDGLKHIGAELKYVRCYLSSNSAGTI